MSSSRGRTRLSLPSVPDRDDGQLDLAAGPPEHHRVPLSPLEQQLSERRAPGDVPLVEVDLVLAHDAVGGPRAVLVLDLDVGAEEDHRDAARVRSALLDD